MNPRFLMAHRHLLRVYDQMGEIPQALEEYVAAAPWLGIPPEKANEQLRILENAYKTFGTEAYSNNGSSWKSNGPRRVSGSGSKRTISFFS